MKSFSHRVYQSLLRPLRQGIPTILLTAMLLLAGGVTRAHGWVAAGRGAGGRGFVAAGGGYRGGYAYRGGVAYRGYGYGGVHVAAVGVRPALPRGYVATIPAGYRSVYYGGYNCYFVGGVYYRPTFYEGSTVYVVVNP